MIKILKYLNKLQQPFVIIKSIASIFICNSLYLLLNTSNIHNIKGTTISIIIIIDLIIKRLLTQSRIYSFNHFLYLQIKKKRLFLYYIVDAFWSISNLLLLLTILYLLISKEFYPLEFIKILFTIFIVNTIMERSLRLIKLKTLFYIISIFFIYLIFIFNLNSITISGVLCFTLLQLSLLYITFKKYLFIQ